MRLVNKVYCQIYNPEVIPFRRVDLHTALKLFRSQTLFKRRFFRLTSSLPLMYFDLFDINFLGNINEPFSFLLTEYVC